MFSVFFIVLLTAMTGWFLARVENKVTRAIYLLLVFSMVVPFQMVMFTMSKLANILHLDNPVGIIFVYVGFGAGLSTFMFTGFARYVPREIEEAACIDGCGPVRTFFSVVFPVLKPTAITVAILNAMWIWNDYLLPYLLLGSTYKTCLLYTSTRKDGEMAYAEVQGTGEGRPYRREELNALLDLAQAGVKQLMDKQIEALGEAAGVIGRKPVLVLATGNFGKVKELRAMLGDRFDVRSMREMGAEMDVEETGETFEENALLKAEAVSYTHLRRKPTF